jgi:hypothetical protein
MLAGQYAIEKNRDGTFGAEEVVYALENIICD